MWVEYMRYELYGDQKQLLRSVWIRINKRQNEREEERDLYLQYFYCVLGIILVICQINNSNEFLKGVVGLNQNVFMFFYSYDLFLGNRRIDRGNEVYLGIE